MPVSSRHSGFRRDIANSRLSVYNDGTEVARFNDATNDLTLLVNGLSITGGETIATGDQRITAGNVRLGVVSAFATTEPVSAVVMKAGTAPAGAIATSGGIYTDGTTVKKIIADGTASDIQT